MRACLPCVRRMDRRSADPANAPRRRPQMKPNVVFFGESITDAVKARSCVPVVGYLEKKGDRELTETAPLNRAEAVADASQLLVMGTSLATYSAFRSVRSSPRTFQQIAHRLAPSTLAFRLIKQARDAKKPVLILSLGPSRADGLDGVEKIEMEAGPVLDLALRGLR